MHSVFKRNSFPHLWTGDVHISGEKIKVDEGYHTFFMIFTPFKCYVFFFRSFVEKVHFFKFQDPMTLEQSQTWINCE